MNETEALKGKKTIVVVGLGGCGCNETVKASKDNPNKGIGWIVINTDKQVLDQITDEGIIKIQIGTESRAGDGAGSDPEIGAQAAKENIEEIIPYLEDAKIVFFIAGEGGGTGTGAAPVIAEALKNKTGSNKKRPLRVAIVTTPFKFEGDKRKDTAREGIKKLKPHVDTLFKISNEKIRELINEDTPVEESLSECNKVVKSLIACTENFFENPGLMNIEFGDLDALLRDGGEGYVGVARVGGRDRARRAAEKAKKCPLLEIGIKGARRVIMNFTGGQDMSLNEIVEVADDMREDFYEYASFKPGMVTLKDGSDGKVEVMIICTDFETSETSDTIVPEIAAKNELSAITVPHPPPSKKSDGHDFDADSDIPGFLRTKAGAATGNNSGE